MATMTTPATVAMDPARLDAVARLFHQQIADGLHPGAGLAVYRYGSPVLDLVGGVADAATGRPVTAETMFVLFSSTKPLAAACLYLLQERGRLNWDDPVARHWPEFAANGKAAVTIRHILSHRGGFPDTPENLPWTDWADWGRVCAAMEQAAPKFAPGEVMAYHPINYGWVIAELVRRIDGRSFDRFLAEELAAPLQLDNAYVNLPPELDGRVSRIHLLEDDADPNGYATTFDRPEVHHTITPGANGIASAGDLARFYAMLERRGTLDGVELLRPETAAAGASLQSEGTDHSLGLFARRSLGMALNDERMGVSTGNPLHTFGHGGAGTSIGWADWDTGLAVGYITNGFRGAETNNARLAAISQAIRDACV